MNSSKVGEIKIKEPIEIHFSHEIAYIYFKKQLIKTGIITPGADKGRKNYAPSIFLITIKPLKRRRLYNMH